MYRNELLRISLLCRDFPGGEGESKFTGRATVEHIPTLEGRRMFGFERFEGEEEFVKKCNELLF